MISAEIETRALEYLAQDEFCSPFEIATVVALWDGNAAEAEALVTDWLARGWVEIVSPDHPDHPDLPPLLGLTDAGYAEVARRRPAS